ncbi:hypothetical protein BC829DRAFT_263596 [Chytridium lagenaria]|nr:hypothetical protein BC829DRAFT_263596 [Chytridium lagenaria]
MASHVHEFGDISNPAGLASASTLQAAASTTRTGAPPPRGDDAGMLVQGSHPGDIGNIKANANGESRQSLG